jgi:hypothetical protein
MSEARILFHLALLENIRKLSDSNILGNLLKLYQVANERVTSRHVSDSRTIKLLGLQG